MTRYRNTQQSMVAEFHCAVGAPDPGTPSPLPPERVALRCRLIEEEAGEFREAAEAGDVHGMIDALVDLLYVTHGAAVEMGIDLEPFFEEVHRVNLAKAPAPDGLKAIKPEGWQPPDIAGVYERLYGAGKPA